MSNTRLDCTNFDCMDVVDTIKTLRLEKGITQKELADALNVDMATISNIERRKRPLRVSELEDFSNALGVRVVDLITYPQRYIPEVQTKSEVTASLTIQLEAEKKEQLLKLVFGDEALKILSK